MNATARRGLLVTVGFTVLTVCSLLLAAPAAKAQSTVYKEIADKGTILWKTAPENAVPSDVCTILQACTGGMKVVVMPPATEGGQRVERGLFWTPGNQKQPMILERRISGAEIYFFLMSPDGKLLKTAYIETGKSWVPMGIALSQPTFDKETKAWHAWVTKPAPVAPAAKPAEPAQ